MKRPDPVAHVQEGHEPVGHGEPYAVDVPAPAKKRTATSVLTPAQMRRRYGRFGTAKPA